MESIRNLYPGLNYTHRGNQIPAVNAFINACSVALHAKCKKVLELGAGHSTALWARYAEMTGAEVTSIDLNFSYLAKRAGKYIDHIKKHVTLLKGSVATGNELLQFYRGKAILNYARLVPPKHRGMLENGKIRSRVLHKYAHKSLEDEAKLINAGQKVQAGGPWDMIVFDSGELSSLLDWDRLKGTIVSGGLAAFHDILYPKSLKNLMPFYDAKQSKLWKLLHLETHTPQGLAIFQCTKS